MWEPQPLNGCGVKLHPPMYASAFNDIAIVRDGNQFPELSLK